MADINRVTSYPDNKSQIRPTSGKREFHTYQMWAGSGRNCCCLGRQL